MRMVYTAAHLWDGTRLHDNSMIVVEDGRIAAMGERTASELPPGANIHNFPDGILAPAFFDVHIRRP
jgi:imidazolonepropionase-like amidohydrolase